MLQICKIEIEYKNKTLINKFQVSHNSMLGKETQGDEAQPQVLQDILCFFYFILRICF